MASASRSAAEWHEHCGLFPHQHPRPPVKWIRCTCICGLAGEKEAHISVPPYATNGQIAAVLRATDDNFYPALFNKIVINGNVYDFTQKDLRVLPFYEKDRHQDTEEGVIIQLIRDSQHPDRL